MKNVNIEEHLYDNATFKSLIKSMRWNFAVTLNTNLTFTGRYAQFQETCKCLRQFQQRVEEKLIRHPERKNMVDRNAWLLRPSLSPEKGLLHFHGVTAIPSGKSKQKLVMLSHRYWTKMFPEGHATCRIMYSPEIWGDYSASGQSDLYESINFRNNVSSWMKNIIILPERR